MNNLRQAVWVEWLKARRSRVPLLTALGFLLAPLAGGFIMLVLKDPELARRLGLISAKAQLSGGSADWPAYLNLLAQATAVGGILLFGLVGSWVFGREFSDRTAKDLLALPTARSSIVLAKFGVVAAWTAGLVGLIVLAGLIVGALLALPLGTPEVFVRGIAVIAITAALTILLVTPIAFFASAGHGYLPALGVSMLALVLAQLIAVAGWGEFFPWSIPALFAGLSRDSVGDLSLISYLIVIVTGALGLVGTFAWWELADQAR